MRIRTLPGGEFMKLDEVEQQVKESKSGRRISGGSDFWMGGRCAGLRGWLTPAPHPARLSSLFPALV